MALTVAELNARLVADTRDFVRDMDKAQKSTDKFADKMQSFGKKATAFLTLPILGAAGAAVNAASDLQESLNKVDVAFGDSSKEVVAFSNTLAKKFGIVKKDSLDAASAIGLIGQASGLTGKESAKLGIDFTKLAADMSSFFNIPFEEALTSLRSGLVGESEPLRRFGVLLSEDAVKAKAYATGIAAMGAELTEAQKVQARTLIIQESLTKANGDLERTQDSASNQMRKFKGDIGNLAAEIGQKLLPKAMELLSWASDALSWFDRLSPATQDIAIKAALLTAALGPLAFAISGVTRAVQALSAAVSFLAAHPIVAFVAALIGLTVWLQTTEGRAQSFRDAIGHAFEAVANTVMSAVGFVVQAINKMLGAFAYTFEVASHLPGIGGQFAGIAEKIREVQDTGERWAANLHRGIDQLTSDAERLSFQLRHIAADTGNVLAGAERIASVDPRRNPGVAGPVPRFHSGGVVPGPRGAEVPAILQAGETVVPAGRGMGGGITIIVQGDVLDGDRLADKVHEGLLRKQRRSGALGLN